LKTSFEFNSNFNLVDNFALTLALGTIAALANVFGGFIVTARSHWNQEFLKYFIAFGSGFLLAAVFLKMIPISYEQSKLAPLFILIGYFVIHFFEHTAVPHFHFGEETHPEFLVPRAVGVSALVGLTTHTFFDGVSIASGFIINPALGFLIFLAIMLHKIPEGFTIASLFLASGRSRKKALISSFIIGAATLAGVVLMQFFHSLVSHGLALSAGVSIYVAASDLIPEVNKEKGIKLSVMVFIGVGLFYVTEFLLEKLGL